jgi:hypothetical protein
VNHHDTSSTNTAATVVKWIARLASLASLGMVLPLFIGENFNPLQLTVSDWAMFAFFPFGIYAGMMLAWWRQGWGGCVTVACLLAFYAMNFADSGKLPGGPWFAIFASPGALFLLSGWLARALPEKKVISDADFL